MFVDAVVEVAGNDDQVRLHRHEHGGGTVDERVVDCVTPMDVAEDADSEALELFGQVFDGDGSVESFEAVGLKESFGEESAEDGCGSPGEDLAAGRFFRHLVWERECAGESTFDLELKDWTTDGLRFGDDLKIDSSSKWHIEAYTGFFTFACDIGWAGVNNELFPVWIDQFVFR